MEHCGRLWKRAPLRSRLQLNFMLKFSKNVHTFQFYSAHDSIISICKSELCDILRSYVIFFFVKLFVSFCFFASRDVGVAGEPWGVPHQSLCRSARTWGTAHGKDWSRSKRQMWYFMLFENSFSMFQVSDAIRFHFDFHLYILIYLKLAVLSWITLDVGRWVAKDALLHASLHVLGSLRPWHCGRCLVSPGAEKGGARGDAGAGEQGTLPSLWKTPHIHFGIFWYFGILIQSYTLYDFHLLSL